eukprot:15343649-Ditylum_brightwellii.AAC.1
MSPIKKETSGNTNGKSPTAAAQNMANMGNLSGATKVLLQDTPVMYVTSETRNSLFKYYLQSGADNTNTQVLAKGPADSLASPMSSAQQHYSALLIYIPYGTTFYFSDTMSYHDRYRTCTAHYG